MVVQAYAYTKYVGNLKVKFDADGEAVSWEGQPRLLDHSVEQGKEKIIKRRVKTMVSLHDIIFFSNTKHDDAVFLGGKDG